MGPGLYTAYIVPFSLRDIIGKCPSVRRAYHTVTTRPRKQFLTAMGTLMVDSINVSDLTVAGRIDKPDPNNGQVAIQKNLDMSNASSFSIDFNAVNQQQTIGVIRTLFADNTSNPSEIVVDALGTGQRFTIPAYSEGYFPIISRLNAGIVLTTAGGATSRVGVTFFNYDIPAVVWYKYGAANKDIAQRVQGAISAGQPATGPYSDGILFSGVDSGGIVRRVAVNASGQVGVDFTNITIGNVKEADGDNKALGAMADAAATDNDYGAWSLIALTKRAVIFLRNISNGANGTLTRLDTLAANTKNAGVGSLSSVPSQLTNIALLVSNPSRMQATVYNESTSVLRIGLSATAVTPTSYTVQVQPGGYYEVPAYYTGTVRGLWDSADGFARVTELS